MNTIAMQKKLAAILLNAEVASPHAAARVIISEVLGIPGTIATPQELSSSDALRMMSCAIRHAQGQPLQYIFHKAFFRNLELYVDENVLIPRPETELLAGFFVDSLPEGSSFLDVGTGSGAIALSVAQERPDVLVTGVDISAQALDVAQKNRHAMGLVNITLKQSDLFSNVSNERYDGIAANLPYVSLEEYSRLDGLVRDREPRLALLADDDGMAVIKDAIDKISNHLTLRGHALFEFGDGQEDNLLQYAINQGLAAAVHEDLSGRPRFLEITMR